MKPIRTDFVPQNRITTPLEGKPVYVNTGIIKTVMRNGEKISVAQIEYQEFDEENFQYVISPYWDIVDGLPSSIFQGIPGIDMDLRLKDYYRVNYIPIFITERTPSENREDLWELLESVGLDYYDRFEWLLRTKLRAGNDHLIVERRRCDKMTVVYNNKAKFDLQYGDDLIVESFEDIADTLTKFNDRMFSIITNGINIISKDKEFLIDASMRSAMVRYLIAQKNMSHNEKTVKRKIGVDNAKKEGKYRGRKPIEVDDNILRNIAKELDDGIITVQDAMKRMDITSRSTFYRKLKKLRNTTLMLEQ